MAEQLRFMTPKEYLAFEKQAEQRHEYVNGVNIAMAGASRRHNLLTLAFASLLRTHQSMGSGLSLCICTDVYKEGIVKMDSFHFLYDKSCTQRKT